MNELPRQKLGEIVARHGRAVAGDVRRVEGLLRDYAGKHRREIAVLVSAAEERVPADLLAAGVGLPREAVLLRLARRLQDNLALEATAAKWAVNSWALALGVISSVELEALEQERAELAPKSVAAPASAGRQPPQTRSHHAAEIIVSVAGDGDFTSLAEALRAATPGARLLVRPGLYRESLVLNKLVELVGEGARAEITLTSADRSCILMQTDEAIVRGLTVYQELGDADGTGFFALDIAQGRLTLEDCDITSRSLSCVGVHNAATAPAIRRCRIHAGADGGVYFFNGAGGTLEDCDIYANANVGVGITTRANPVIKHCAVHQGKHAGVVSWQGGLGVLEECEISGNAKADIGVSEGAELTIHRCRIYGGENSGVFVHQNGSASLAECDIYGHTEPEVAVSQGGRLVALRCRIHEGKNSGVFVDSEGMANLEHCNVYANADAGVGVYAGGVAALRQSRINHNGGAAVRVEDGGAANVEGCDLTENGGGAWEVGPGAEVESRNNRS
jgi:hypothetical protein